MSMRPSESLSRATAAPMTFTASVSNASVGGGINRPSTAAGLSQHSHTLDDTRLSRMAGTDSLRERFTARTRPRIPFPVPESDSVQPNAVPSSSVMHVPPIPLTNPAHLAASSSSGPFPAYQRTDSGQSLRPQVDDSEAVFSRHPSNDDLGLLSLSPPPSPRQRVLSSNADSTQAIISSPVEERPPRESMSTPFRHPILADLLTSPTNNTRFVAGQLYPARPPTTEPRATPPEPVPVVEPIRPPLRRGNAEVGNGVLRPGSVVPSASTRSATAPEHRATITPWEFQSAGPQLSTSAQQLRSTDAVVEPVYAAPSSQHRTQAQPPPRNFTTPMPSGSSQSHRQHTTIPPVPTTFPSQPKPSETASRSQPLADREITSTLDSTRRGHAEPTPVKETTPTYSVIPPIPLAPNSSPRNRTTSNDLPSRSSNVPPVSQDHTHRRNVSSSHQKSNVSIPQPPQVNTLIPTPPTATVPPPSTKAAQPQHRQIDPSSSETLPITRIASHESGGRPNIKRSASPMRTSADVPSKAAPAVASSTLKRSSSRSSLRPSSENQDAKSQSKKGFMQIFRTANGKTVESSKAAPSAVSASRPLEASSSKRTDDTTSQSSKQPPPRPPPLKVPSSSAPKQHSRSASQNINATQPSAFTPYKYMTAKRHRTVSSASLEAVNGTAVRLLAML